MSLDSFFSAIYSRTKERKPYFATIKKILPKGIAVLNNGTQVEVTPEYKVGMRVLVVQTSMNPTVLKP